MNKEIKKFQDFQKWFERYAVKNFGEKCKSFTWGCPICRAHFVKEMFADFVEDLVETEEWFTQKE